MGQLIIHQETGLLELDGFLLQVNDQVEIFHLNTWVPGIVACDQQGWHLRTGENTTLRLQTGMTTRLCELSP